MLWDCYMDKKSLAAMENRRQRLDDFGEEGEPPTGEPIELLCEDHVGTYVIPFPCQWVDRVSARTQANSTPQ
jgi:hypothetical protein